MTNPQQQQEKTYFDVIFTLDRPVGNQTKMNLKMDKETLEKFIGRYTMNYGPPMDLSNGRDNISIYEFSKRDKLGVHTGMLRFERAKEAPMEKYTTAPPPKEPVKQPEQIQALLDANVITETNKWGY